MLIEVDKGFPSVSYDERVLPRAVNV